MKTTHGIILYCIPQEKYLLCHATASRNGWSIPKGLAEEGEEGFEAALRELKEETGIDPGSLRIRERKLMEPVRYRKQNKALQPYYLATEDDITGMPMICTSYTQKGYPEIDRYLWVSADRFRELAHETQVTALDQLLK